MPRHVFLVGCARTGSTLLRHVLNRSSQVVIAPETHFARRAENLHLAHRLKEARTDAALEELVELLYGVDEQSATGYWAWLRRNVPRSEVATRLAGTDRSLRAFFVLLLDIYVERSHVGDPPTVIGEKTPAHLAFVPTLDRWFPQATVIHTFRDPRAVYASELRRRREGRWGVKRRLRVIPDRILDPLLAPLELVRTTISWRRADRLDVVYRRLLGDRYRLVRFEDLVRDPDAQLEAICGTIGIGFDAAMLEIDVVGSSFEAQRHATGGFDPATAERWRNHVSGVTRAWFRFALGRRMRARGYLA